MLVHMRDYPAAQKADLMCNIQFEKVIQSISANSRTNRCNFYLECLFYSKKLFQYLAKKNP